MVHTEKGMREAVKLYTDKGEISAIEMVVKNQLEKVQNRIKQLDPEDAGQVTEYLVEIREKRNANKKNTDAEVDADNLAENISNNITTENCDEVSRSTVVEENVLNNANESNKCNAVADQNVDISFASNTDSSDAAEAEIPTTTRGGRRQGRRASRKRSLCRSDEMMNETTEMAANVSKRGRGRGARNVRQGRAGQTANRKIRQRDLLVVPSSPVGGELASEDTITQMVDFDQESNNVTKHQPTTSMTTRSSQYKKTLTIRRHGHYSSQLDGVLCLACKLLPWTSGTFAVAAALPSQYLKRSDMNNMLGIGVKRDDDQFDREDRDYRPLMFGKRYPDYQLPMFG
ncbi:Double-strand break repair protein [Trichinella spiralis]|uniref:Double-strand break repair protein n=1 Tax=Trichinella spiralis TaxID=6334 RepID=A0ABR3KFA7_TRISP